MSAVLPVIGPGLSSTSPDKRRRRRTIDKMIRLIVAPGNTTDCKLYISVLHCT